MMKRIYHAPKVEILAVSETQNILSSSLQQFKYQFQGYELKESDTDGRELILKYGKYGDPETARTPERLGWDDLDN